MTDPAYFSSQNLDDFKIGRNFHLYKIFGAHKFELDGCPGVYFSVYAPNAKGVSVVGLFNDWDVHKHCLFSIRSVAGIWEGFIPGLTDEGYEFVIQVKEGGERLYKIDPFGFSFEDPSKPCAKIVDLNYDWKDHRWKEKCDRWLEMNKAISIYELHLGSWKSSETGSNGRFMSYRELADKLIPYIKELGFTHVELMPLCEHPFYGSWGYQALGYFAPSVRYGSPLDLMYFIDCCHHQDIGVIFDWNPSHFPNDSFGLAQYDGSPIFERKHSHPQWGSCVFDIGNMNVVQFLVSSVLFWCEYYHIDGFRVDDVASMLYLDYSRKKGEWGYNLVGGRENLESIAFFRKLNDTVHQYFPNCLMIAEDSTQWPKVTAPSYEGGLGFDMKWNMGWKHESLKYFQSSYGLREDNEEKVANSFFRAYGENYCLALSHDEVVHGQGSLLSKMEGCLTDQFSNLKALYGLMFAHPGKKMIFMGAEFAQKQEWCHERILDWELLEEKGHKYVWQWVKDLNVLYKTKKALYECDFNENGLQFLDSKSSPKGVFSFLRKGRQKGDTILIVSNLMDKKLSKYAVNVGTDVRSQLLLSSDDTLYGGFGTNIFETSKPALNSLVLNLPPISTVFIKLN